MSRQVNNDDNSSSSSSTPIHRSYTASTTRAVAGRHMTTGLGSLEVPPYVRSVTSTRLSTSYVLMCYLVFKTRLSGISEVCEQLAYSSYCCCTNTRSTRSLVYFVVSTNAMCPSRRTVPREGAKDATIRILRVT